MTTFPSREKALSVLMTENGRRERTPHLTTNALLGLMRLASTSEGRADRTAVIGGAKVGHMMSLDDVQELMARKWIETDGARYLAITEAGNRLSRHLLETAREFES